MELKYVKSFDKFFESEVDESIFIGDEEALTEGILDSYAYNGWQRVKESPMYLIGVAKIANNTELKPEIQEALKKGIEQISKEIGIDIQALVDDKDNPMRKKLMSISAPATSDVGKQIKDKITYKKNEFPKNAVYNAVYYSLLNKKGYTNNKSGGTSTSVEGFDPKNVIAYANKGELKIK